jgi:hypothetical protein
MRAHGMCKSAAAGRGKETAIAILVHLLSTLLMVTCCLQTNAPKGEQGHLEVMQAFDYVLGRLGSDSAAATLWMEFVDFLASFPPSSSAFRLLFEPEPGKEASKRALRLRDLYHRALQVWPLLSHCSAAR